MYEGLLSKHCSVWFVAIVKICYHQDNEYSVIRIVNLLIPLDLAYILHSDEKHERGISPAQHASHGEPLVCL